jgi:Uma2 family endonuclease
MMAHARITALGRNGRMHMALDTRPWSPADLDRLPDDGNRYEVIAGELLVTPPPSDLHEEVVAWLTMALLPFVREHRLGMVYHPRSIVRIAGQQAEPDLMVRASGPLRGWDHAPLPMLIVEVISRSTRHRDLGSKRRFYMESGIAEYWIVDRERERVIQIRNNEEREITQIIRWSPPGGSAAIDIDIAAMFAEIRSRSDR